MKPFKLQKDSPFHLSPLSWDPHGTSLVGSEGLGKKQCEKSHPKHISSVKECWRDYKAPSQMLSSTYLSKNWCWGWFCGFWSSVLKEGDI